MVYYKVKPECDQKRKGTKGDIYIENELYTPSEMVKQNLNPAYLEKVEIPKSRVYFSFGCRFAAEA